MQSKSVMLILQKSYTHVLFFFDTLAVEISNRSGPAWFLDWPGVFDGLHATGVFRNPGISERDSGHGPVRIWGQIVRDDSVSTPNIPGCLEEYKLAMQNFPAS